MKRLILIATLILTASLNTFPQKNYYDCSAKKPDILLEEFNDNINKWPLSDNLYSLKKIENGKLYIQSKEWKPKASYIVVPLEESANWEIELKIECIQGPNTFGSGLIWGANNDSKKQFRFSFLGNGHYVINRYYDNEIIYFVK